MKRFLLYIAVLLCCASCVRRGTVDDGVAYDPDAPAPPLVQAIEDGADAEALEALLADGASLEEADGMGMTPLMAAGAYGTPALVSFLLDRGADAKAKDIDGWDAFCWAAYANPDPEVLAVLLPYGNVLAGDVDGDTPLLLATMHNTPAVVDRLLSYGSDRLVRDDQGMDLAMAGAMHPDAEMVRHLLAIHVPFSGTDDEGNTPLMYAAMVNPAIDVVTRLVFDVPSDVHAVNHEGQDALMFAAGYNENPETACFLIDCGADPYLMDGEGRSSLLWAAVNPSPEMVRALCSYGVKTTTVDYRGRSALHYAALAGYPETATALVELGIPAERRDDAGDTPLLLAVSAQDGAMVRALLDAGSSCEAVGRDGLDALHRAARDNPDPDVVRVLIAAGAPVDGRGREGETALMLASGAGHGEVVRALLDAGADATLKDDAGWNALRYAAFKGGGDRTITTMLEQAGAKLW